MPKDSWFTRVECSRFAAGTAYVTIDRHRSDDLKPYVFKTTDYGGTWTSLVNNLPSRGGVHVIRESPRNRDLLFVGTEWGLFASVDGGQYWQHLKSGIPAQVCVHDLVVHPRDPTLVIGTLGRSLYVMDIAAAESAGSVAAQGVQDEARRRVLFPKLRRIVGRIR